MPPAPRLATLDLIELHLWSRAGAPLAADLTVGRATPRRGPARVDVGFLGEDQGPWAAACRATATTPLSLLVGPDTVRGRLRGEAETAVELSIKPSFVRAGLLLATARGRVEALGRRIEVEDARLLLVHRKARRRPYAWARATLCGTIDDQPILCAVETARSRAGSVVLPELGRLRLLGPGARLLPRACALSPLPLRAEYGTGRLRASAIAPGLRLSLELDAPPATTGLFEVVDPSGESAYAHRALFSTARLRIERRGRRLAEVALEGRYEWGARAGDPRVALRAWRD